MISSTAMYEVMYPTNQANPEPVKHSIEKRVLINGKFRGNRQTSTETTIDTVIGCREQVYYKRNGIPCASDGDKSYAVPEYSPEFHKDGSTRPAVDFSRTNQLVTDTFIPLVPIPDKPCISFAAKEKAKRYREELDEVKGLDDWKPAPKLTVTLNFK